MAELESETSSSVTHLPNQQDTSLSFSGSGTSEVNKDAFISDDCQFEKNNILPSSNDNNDFKSNNGSPFNILNEDEHLEQTEEDEMHVKVCNNAELEIQENIKNEQMTQRQQHSFSSHSSEIDGGNGNSVECKGEKKVKSLNNENKGTKKKREVHFPDDSFIRDSLDPPDPWKDAPACTTDDLITAYKKSCEIHGSKPVVKILQQLHGISPPRKRKESFILKGEKLDLKQVECIEEILRRVQFQLIDLEATHLDDETAGALFDMIEHYESACQLNVSFNRNIGARGWQACSRLVRRTPTLNFLDIRNCDLNERTIPIFGRALKMGCHLTVLHMEGMQLTTRPLIILVAALKMNENLQELFLAENKLVPTDGVQLGNLLRYNHRLHLLDLRNNNLQDVGVSHLCDGLVEQKSGHGLRTLVLWNNQISYQAMHALGRALENSTSLETLNIGHNGITNEGVHLIKDGLLKTTSLLRLGLQGTRISDEGGVALAEYIADSTILLRIDLRDNDIKTGGLMALSHAMRVNNSVTRIDLDKETKKESGMKDYADVQIRLLRDILTFQERNVQLVMEREEAERAMLERMAIEAAAAREKEKLEKETEGGCPLATVVSNTESFTIIEAESVEMTEEVENDGVKDQDESSSSVQKEIEVPTSLSSLTFSEEEEQMPAHQRPSVLFARMGLQPQESLDSPRTPSDQSEVFQSPLETSAEVPLYRPSLPLSIPDAYSLSANTPPGDLLLSPQYCPKQLARKIFSVSRVSEEMCSSPPTFPSADGLCEYDPLNVSLMSLVPATDPHPSASAPAPSQPSIITSSSRPAVSPATLFQDLANETVKHIVSTEEPDLPMLSSNTRLSSSAEFESEDTAVAESDLNVLKNCDKIEEHNQNNLLLNQPTASLLSTRETDLPLFTNSVENSEQTSVVAEVDSVKVDKAPSVVKESENTGKVCDETLPTSNVTDQDTLEAMANTLKSSGCSESPAMSELDSQTVTEDKMISDRLDIVDSNTNVNEFLSNVSSMTETDKIDSFLSNVSTSCSSASSSNSSSALENTSSSLEAANNPSILSHEKQGDVSEDKILSSSEIAPTTNVTQGISTDGQKHVDGEAKKLSADKEDQVIADGTELDNVEEEPWTSLETDESGTASLSGHRIPEAKQPDFFTTLSMNGLTQELASALTSLDGSPQDRDQTLVSQGPDDFERELDAIVAGVQNESPSTVTN